jgi:hypothetical protein
VTAVVRCDPVVRGPDVAPAVTSLEGASERSVQPGCYADGPAQRPSDRPLLSVSDRQGPMLRARPARTTLALARLRRSPAGPKGEARPRCPLASLASSAGARQQGTARGAVVYSLTQPVTRRCSLLIRGAPSKNVAWPEK